MVMDATLNPNEKKATEIDAGYYSDAPKNNAPSALITNKRNSEKLNKALHSAPETGTTKLIKATGGAAATIAESTQNIFASTMSGIKRMLQTGNGKKGTRDLVFGVLSAGFGLTALKSLIDIPKILSNPKENPNKSPLIFKGVTLLTGSAIALGLYKTVMGTGVGLGLPGLLVGLACFFGLNVMTSAFENPNGAPGRLSNLLGIRGPLSRFMNSLRFNFGTDK